MNTLTQDVFGLVHAQQRSHCHCITKMLSVKTFLAILSLDDNKVVPFIDVAVCLSTSLDAAVVLPLSNRSQVMAYTLTLL
jgi:hypothetical protein